MCVHVFGCLYVCVCGVCDIIKMAVVSHVFAEKTSCNHQPRGAGFVAFYPSFPPHPLDLFGTVSWLEAESASEATYGDWSSRYPSYSLTASRCPIASRFRVHSHHCFVRRSPDSGGGSLTRLWTRNPKGVPSYSCARVVVRGFCYHAPLSAAGPGLPRALPSQRYVLWAVSRFQGVRVCTSMSACVHMCMHVWDSMYVGDGMIGVHVCMTSAKVNVP